MSPERRYSSERFSPDAIAILRRLNFVEHGAAGRAQRVELQRRRLLLRGDARVTDEPGFGNRDSLEDVQPSQTRSWALFGVVFCRFVAGAALEEIVEAETTEPA